MQLVEKLPAPLAWLIAQLNNLEAWEKQTTAFAKHCEELVVRKGDDAIVREVRGCFHQYARALCSQAFESRALVLRGQVPRSVFRHGVRRGRCDRVGAGAARADEHQRDVQSAVVRLDQGARSAIFTAVSQRG